MKPLFKTICLLTGVAVVFSSCKHDDVYRPEKPGGTAGLVVPEGFDWSMTRSVALKVNSPVATSASFFLDEMCTPESQIATLAVPEGETTFNFDVPKVNKAIYVQYPLQSGGTETLKSTITDSRTKAMEGSGDVMFTEPKAGNMGGTFYIPARNTWGTLMFEDTWPETGDYDFNDVVINYKMEANQNPADQEIVLKVSLKIRALGGSLPYDFAIIIGQTRSHEGPMFVESDLKEITDIFVEDNRISVKELSGTGYPAIILEGLDALRVPGTYYNTNEKTDAGVEVNFTVKLACTQSDCEVIFSCFGDPLNFDYFLINQNNKREIHFIGFSPTSLYTTYEEDNTGGGTYYYMNEEKLVWGLKVPALIGWAKEKHDIMTVYGGFETWVKSAGYAIGSNGYDPYIWYDESDGAVIDWKYCIDPGFNVKPSQK